MKHGAAQSPRVLAFRAVGVLAASALLLLVWQDGATRAAGAAAVDDLVVDTGLARRSPDLTRSARREPDPYWGRLAVARALVAEAVDPSHFTSLPSREAALEMGRVGERLELAQRLAADAAAQRPVVWQAPMLVGAASYLEASRTGSPRLLTDRASWQAPLERAAALAPGSHEPARFLAAADLETWRALSPEEQDAARQVIGEAFSDPATFRRLAGPWMEVAESRDVAFALVPDSPESWEVVGRWAAGRRDWDTYCVAADRGDDALTRDAAQRLAEVEARLAGGDPVGARAAALALVAAAPPDRELASTVARALELCPPGPATSQSIKAFAPWLEWALAGFARGVTLLPTQAVGRLVEGSRTLDPPQRALALLAAGRLVEAEALDRHVEDLNTERWAPYDLSKARDLADRGEIEGARTAFALVHPTWRDLPQAGPLASRLGVHGAPPAAASSWPATAWRWHRGTAWLDVLPATPGPALDITIAQAPAAGAVAEVAVGFSRVWRGEVGAGATITVPITTPAPDAPLVVTLRSVAGGRVMPGEVRMVDPSSMRETT